ncbi:MAG TPA: ABC transporter ATP-binding protein [Anaerolineales bacterium]
MRSLVRLGAFVRPYIPHTFLNLVFLLGLTGLSLVVPRILQAVIDQGLSRGQASFLLQSALLLLGLGLLSALLNLAQRYLSEWIAARVGYDLRNRLYDHIQNQPFAFHDHAESGQLISRCIEDVRAIERFAGGSIGDLIRLILLGLGIIFLMVSTNPALAVVALLPLVPLTIMTAGFGRQIGPLFLAVDNAVGEVSNRLQENVTGVQVVRAFAREKYEIERFEGANMQVFTHWVKVIDQWAKVMPTTTWLITLSTILLLLFGGRQVIDGRITVGAIVAFNAYVLMLGEPAQQLTNLVNQAGETVAGTQRVFEVLDHRPEIQSPPDAIHPGTLHGRVDFEDVGLKYLDEKTASIAGVSLHVEPNQLVALIGPTGSGKTSLVNLIPRFYDVTSGAVLLDGHDVRKLDLVALRRQIGIVLQTSLLFSDTIRANIAYGRPDATEEQVVAAAAAAQADEFIASLPAGYDTVVGERGVTLSGGQRQRVAIARALLMDPRILILDDSTSSVDTQTEKLIQAALDRLMQGRTTFVIAHRLSTVRRADQILVLDRGRIVQRGTHADLLREGGLYREIYDLQLADRAVVEEQAAEVAPLSGSRSRGASDLSEADDMPPQTDAN